jgi:hypothetical protein
MSRIDPRFAEPIVAARIFISTMQETVSKADEKRAHSTPGSLR